MFRIFRIDAGWIMGEIKDGTRSHFFDYSWITNFLDDLMKALLCVHGDWEQDERAGQFRGEWEPAVDCWYLQMEGGRLFIHIDRYKDEKEETTCEKIHLEFDYYDFLEEFVDVMKGVLDKYGLLGYRKAWGEEFPISLFLKLADISEGSDKVKFFVIPEKDNMGCETLGTELNLEMEILDRLRGRQMTDGEKI